MNNNLYSVPLKTYCIWVDRVGIPDKYYELNNKVYWYQAPIDWVDTILLLIHHGY